MTVKRKVLFICVHNSARSQMAEAFVRKLAGNRCEAESAGLEPGELNPLAVEVMKEVGIDISGNTTKSVFDLFNQARRYDDVITVCDESQKERCPVFPGTARKDHWSFADPAAFDGTFEQRLAETRRVRDAIQARVRGWLMQVDENKIS